MSEKSISCICKCQSNCECTPDDSAACEDEMKVLESRRVSIAVDVISNENEPCTKNESQETQHETPSTKPEPYICGPQDAEGKGANAIRPCRASNPTQICMGNEKSEENELDKPQEQKLPRTSSLKLFSKRSNSLNSLSTINSDYSKEEWDRFGLFIASECKSMGKEKAKNFKKKCLELILEYQ